MRNSNSGFTIIEVLTGIALMGIVTYGIVSGTTALFSTEAKTGNLGQENKIIQSIVENISTDPAIYQKNFVATDADTNSLLDPANLPWGYGNDYWGPRDACDKKKVVCEGFVGYFIRPLPTMPGMFEVNLRLARVTPGTGATTIQDYVFLTHSN